MAIIFKVKPSTVEMFRFGKINDVAEFSKEVLGGKGANLAEMASYNFPVPPGFIIPTSECVKFMGMLNSPAKVASYLKDAVSKAIEGMDYLTECFGYTPLVSVRSGARVSMPGMMDTILNVGLTSETFHFWVDKIGDRAAADSYRRLVQMLGSVAFGVDMAAFDKILETVKHDNGVSSDADLSYLMLMRVLDGYLKVFKASTGDDFPDTLVGQLQAAIKAVFTSWNNPRAKEYRKIHGYSDDWGTAVNIQAMVFGNMNDKSATGVVFTRCPSTGINQFTGEYLVNAQGEDVVAGIRTPEPLHSMAAWDSAAYAQLKNVLTSLEEHYRDMQDVEFTVQDGELFILQTRNGKRSAQAAFKIAHDLEVAGRITKQEAINRINRAQMIAAMTTKIHPDFKVKPHFSGIAAGGGVVSGKAVFSSDNAVNCTEPCVLVRSETDPNDIAGMNASVGILTATGGLTSHAAVVARGMNKTCVVGATDMSINGNVAFVSGTGISSFTEGQKITIDGTTGHVWVGVDVPVVGGKGTDEMYRVLEWAAAGTQGVHIRWTPDGTETMETLLDVFKTTLPVYVDVAMISEPGGLTRNLKAALTGNADSVVIDLSDRGKYYSKSDFSILWMFGESQSAHPLSMFGELQKFFGEIEPHQLARFKVVNAGVDAKQYLDKFGVLAGQTVKTFQDLLKGESMEATPEVISNVFGSKEAFEHAVKMVEAHLGKPFPKYVCPVPKYWFQILEK